MASLLSSSTTPKYPYPHELNIVSLVPIKLSLKTFFVWRKLMLDVVENQGLLGFIDGTTVSPLERTTVPDDGSVTGTMEIENQDYKDWKRTDQLLLRWFLSTLEAQGRLAFQGCPSAKAMWMMLEKMFNQFREPSERVINEEAGKNLSHYLPLHRAALKGDWESANNFIEKEPDSVRAIITGYLETALMVAVRSGQRKHFLKKLLQLMLPADLTVADRLGITALHIAAGVGNVEVAKLLVQKNPDTPDVPDIGKSKPLLIAALHGRRNMFSYLITVTKEDVEPRPFDGQSGSMLLQALLFNELYDLALSLLQSYSKLACEEPCPLLAMTIIHPAFPSRTRFNFWQRIIYTYVPAEPKSITNHAQEGNNKTSTNNAIFSLSVGKKLHAAFWAVIEGLVPQVRHIRDRKLKHCEARQFVKCLCLEVVKLKFFKALPIIAWPLGAAVGMGIHEIVEEIFESFPGILYLKMMNLETVFHQAILFRRENVFNIIYQFEGAEHYLLSLPDASGNNCFHAAGRLVPQQKSNLRARTAGAAMQVQKEVQWFKEVERLMQPADREKRNIEGKTPAMVFTETHEELVKEAEKWMKDTAKSYTIVASLVLTVVFVSAIVIPGGNNSDNGLPRFYIEKAYDVFVISDALALFSSTSCVLIFLSILTSRYAENDFLYGLPNRMIGGLLTLFISIVSMMIASSIAIYLVFGDKTAWTLILAAGLACLPVTFFASLQFSLLFDMIKSTYFPGLFRRRTDLILY